MIRELYKEIRTDPKLNWIRRGWYAALIVLTTISGLLIYAATTGIPSFETLENPNYKLATEIYDINHQIFGTYYVENRIPIDYNQLNPHI